MTALLIRNFDAPLHEALRQRAKAHAQSLEAEARAILTAALRTEMSSNWDNIVTVRTGKQHPVTRDEINSSYEDPHASDPR